MCSCRWQALRWCWAVTTAVVCFWAGEVQGEMLPQSKRLCRPADHHVDGHVVWRHGRNSTGTVWLCSTAPCNHIINFSFTLTETTARAIFTLFVSVFVGSSPESQRSVSSWATSLLHSPMRCIASDSLSNQMRRMWQKMSNWQLVSNQVLMHIHRTRKGS